MREGFISVLSFSLGSALEPLTQVVPNERQMLARNSTQYPLRLKLDARDFQEIFQKKLRLLCRDHVKKWRVPVSKPSVSNPTNVLPSSQVDERRLEKLFIRRNALSGRGLHCEQKALDNRYVIS